MTHATRTFSDGLVDWHVTLIDGELVFRFGAHERRLATTPDFDRAAFERTSDGTFRRLLNTARATE